VTYTGSDITSPSVCLVNEASTHGGPG
jgi:hypothetical protein